MQFCTGTRSFTSRTSIYRLYFEKRVVCCDRTALCSLFQAGEGTAEVAAGFRRLGYDVTLTRFHRMPDHVARLLGAAGFREEARLVRRPLAEQHDQAFLICRAATET